MTARQRERTHVAFGERSRDHVGTADRIRHQQPDGGARQDLFGRPFRAAAAIDAVRQLHLAEHVATICAGPDDVEGSTFSLSNLGMYDVEHFIAVLNPPEAGILAVGSAREVPVIENGEVRAGLRMKATISDMALVDDHATAVERELVDQVWSIQQPAFQERLATLQQKISKH